jgi:hypothetical protein
MAGGLYVPANHELHSSAHLMAQAFYPEANRRTACVHLLLFEA